MFDEFIVVVVATLTCLCLDPGEEASTSVQQNLDDKGGTDVQTCWYIFLSVYGELAHSMVDYPRECLHAEEIPIFRIRSSKNELVDHAVVQTFVLKDECLKDGADREQRWETFGEKARQDARHSGRISLTTNEANDYIQ